MSSNVVRPTQERKDIKIISLVVLTVQTALLSLSMRYACTRKGDLFISSTAVVMGEVVKLVTSLSLVYIYEAYSVTHFVRILYTTTVKQPMDTLKVFIPSIAYVIQNNLVYVAATHLDAATVQVTYQLRILTTALFSVVLLRRSLGVNQWLALLLLLSGVGLVQISNVKDDSAAEFVEQNRMIGMAAALCTCVLSGFAGVYFEKILKGSDISLWIRNAQFSAISIPAGLAHTAVSDWKTVTNKGFFVGYNYFVVYVIFLQAFGGLLITLVIKYADNILKGFATSLAIVLACVFSIYLFNFAINWKFVCGASLVMASVFLYGMPMKKSKKPTTYNPTNAADIETT